MLITFFDVKDIAKTGFLSQNQMINQYVYKDIVLRILCEKKRELWQDKSWLLNHFNVQVHILSIRQYLAEKNIVILGQPPYSRDLASFDFFSSSL